MRLIDMGRCAGCNAPCDGGVCDWRCEEAAYERLLAARLKAGTWKLCVRCDEPTPVEDLESDVCEACRERAQEVEAGKVANS